MTRVTFPRPYRLEVAAASGSRVLGTFATVDTARRAAARLRHLNPDHPPMRITDSRKAAR